MEPSVVFSNPELKRRYEAVQAELAEKIKESMEQLTRRVEDRWGEKSMTPQRIFATIPPDELMRAAVTVFTIAEIMGVAHMKEADIPAMAKVMFTTFFGYCLTARIEMEDTPNRE